MTQSVFDDKSQEQAQDTEQQKEVVTSIFSIGERSYTKEDAITKITNADSHIQNLESDNADLRKKVDEYMQVLSELKKPESKPEEKGATPSITSEEVAKMVRDEYSSISTQQAEQANINTVSDKLTEMFGSVEAAGAEVNKKAQELGMPVEEMLNVAKRSPSAVLGWFQQEPTPSTPNNGSSHNTEAIQNNYQGAEKGTWAYWKDIQKSDPKYYNSPKGYRERMKDADRLGRDKFFGN